MISGVNIKVIRKGSDDKTNVVRLKSDANGRFSAQLADGFYIAFFSIPGFRTAVAPFELTKEGSAELQVTLQIASTT